MPVHFDDLDALGIMHNARYAVLLERALTSFWADFGHSFANGAPTTSDVCIAVRELAIGFQLPIRGTGPVAVHFWIEKLGQTSAIYKFRFATPDLKSTYAEGHRTVIKVDPDTLRPAPWTDEARAISVQLLSPAA